MQRLRIGVIAPASIAIKRFMPALRQNKYFIFAGVAFATFEERSEYETLSFDEIALKCQAQQKRAENMVKEYGGKIFKGYHSLLKSNEVDAVYIPLPPALHYKYAKIAVQNKKHIMLEKPFTVSKEYTEELLILSKENNIALHENYMFAFHSQIDMIHQYVNSGKLGEIRKADFNFGFPLRTEGDFRYRNELGGGALLDCGGYTIKAASIFFDNYDVICAHNIKSQKYSVDMFGTATLLSSNDCIINLAYGMDNAYLCELRLWGTKGLIWTERFFTPPPDLTLKIFVRFSDNNSEEIFVPSTDTFEASLSYFASCINNLAEREKNYNKIKIQSKRMQEISRLC